MRRGLVISCVLSLVGVTLVSAPAAWSQSAPVRTRPPSADSRPTREDPLLAKVRVMIQQQQHRAAEQLIADASRDLEKASESAGRWRAIALGDIYVRSGQYERALEWLSPLMDRLERVVPLTTSLLDDQCQVALLQADAYEQVGEKRKAVTILQRVFARCERFRSRDPAQQIELLVRLAELGESRVSADKSSSPLERAVVLLASQAERQYKKKSMTIDAYADSMRGLARYYQASSQGQLAARTLTRLLEQMRSQGVEENELATWKQLAEVQRGSRDFAGEANALRSAAQLIELLSAADKNSVTGSDAWRAYEKAELERLLANALLAAGQRADVAEHLTRAFKNYTVALAAATPQATPMPDGRPVARVAILERLVEVSERLQSEPQADRSRNSADDLQVHGDLLDEYERILLPDDPRIARLRVVLGGLYLNSGDYQRARSELSAARQYWQNHRPIDYPMLGQALSLSGEAALNAGSLNEAQTALDDAKRVCEQHLPDSELRWWVGLNLGRLAASAGEYQLALNRFREVCAAAAAKPLSREFHCAALLNLGLLHKDLLQFEDASQCCRQALSLRQQDLGPNHADLLPYYHALGGIHIARRDADALSEIAETIERLSGGLPKQHANALTSRHQLAMMHYLRDEFESRDSERRHAREIWTDVLDTARSAGQPMVAARTLHYLARLDYLDVLADLRNWKTSLAQLRGTDSRQLQQLRELTVDFERRSSELQVQRQRYLEDLEKYDRRADSDHEARVRAHQALVETHGKLDQERSTLGKLRNEIEQAQSRLEESRNRLAAQTSLPGGDHAGRWHDRLKQGLSRASEAVATLRDLDRYPSLHYAALCNYAQLLNVNSKWNDQGTNLAQAIEALERAIQLIESSRSHAFGGDLARAEYFVQYQAAFDLLVQIHVQRGQLFEAIVAAERGRGQALLDHLRSSKRSPGVPPTKEADRLVRSWQSSNEPVLYYYVGGARSYLFVLGGTQHKLQAYPLVASADPALPQSTTDASAEMIAEVVALLRASLDDAKTFANLAENSLLRQRLAASSTVLLPAEALQYLIQQKALGVSHIVVVPHGAISQFPLEALVLGEASGGTYLHDVGPPIAYAPSLTVLNELRERAPTDPPRPLLLTVGNPDYSSRRDTSVQPATFTEPTGPLVPVGAKELRHIADTFRSAFGTDSVTMLTGNDATEMNLRANTGRTKYSFFHCAAHGIIDDQPGIATGSIALARPMGSSDTGDDDGSLSLGEIERLDLSGCQLAALSACDTNVALPLTVQFRGRPSGGPVVKSRAVTAKSNSGLTIANAFLAGGSQRVVATQWKVADNSTSELFGIFFDKLTAQLAAKQRVNYAQLLADARNELRRKHPEWNTPFYWAPFVLIGPAMGL